MKRRRELPPLRQGSLDGLCGLYALINASRLALPSLAMRVCTRLFREALHWLLDRQSYPETLCDGLNVNTLLRLHRAVFQPGLPLSMHRPFLRNLPKDNREFWRRMEDESLRQGQSLIICFENRYRSHWTVVRKVAAERVILFDSSGLCFLPRPGCAFRSEQKPIHLIAPGGVLLLKKTASKRQTRKQPRGAKAPCE
jgi:hypothetical protein